VQGETGPLEGIKQESQAKPGDTRPKAAITLKVTHDNSTHSVHGKAKGLSYLTQHQQTRNPSKPALHNISKTENSSKATCSN
jgi:hypothetical protein